MRYETIEKNGKSFVVLPIATFEKLQHDAEMINDIKAYDEAIAEGGEYFPSEVVYSVLEGQNKIKVYREYRKMTQEDLAKKTKLSRAYIAQIETDKKNGSIAALKKLATALNVDIDDLV